MANFASVAEFKTYYLSIIGGDAFPTSLETGLQFALGEATRLIRSESVVYKVDTDGDPTDSDEIAALRDACCAQVSYWIELGGGTSVDKSADVLGLTGMIKAGDVTRSAPRECAPRMVRTLRQAGLWRP